MSTSIISITEQKTFAATFGGRTIAGLAVESAWKGFTNYVGADGNLIVEDATMRVITGSPKMLSLLAIGEPQIGDVFEGGIYAGMTTVDGKPARLISLPGSTSGSWNQCMAWAKEQGSDMPTKDEWPQVAEALKITGDQPSGWHWSSTQHADFSANAWLQDFNDGDQYFTRKSHPGHARPVRRLPI